MPSRTVLRVGSGAALLLLVAGGVYLSMRPDGRRPVQGSPEYENVVRAFFRGLASLDVGTVDDARRDFTRVTELADEPAAWANLGLAHLRLGELNLAAAAIERAAAMAPSSSAIAFLQAQVETLGGSLDEAIAHLRRAVELDPASLTARYALAQEVERAAGPDADANAQQVLEELYQLQPGNLAVLLERTRLAAKRGDEPRLRESAAALAARAGMWPPAAAGLLGTLQTAVDAADFTAAARAAVVLRNVLVRVPDFREGQARINPPSELIAEPLRRFVTLAPPSAMPSAPDRTLAFTRELIDAGPAPVDAVLAFSPNGTAVPVAFVQRGSELDRVGATQAPLPVPVAAGIAAADWNRDFLVDLAVAGRGGLRLLTQTADGTFMDVTDVAAGLGAAATADSFGVWAADLEMDGDLDLIVGVIDAPPLALRNNGDSTWQPLQLFGGVAGVHRFVWGDIDGDGDPDAALLHAPGALHVFENRQAGEFREMPEPAGASQVIAMALGDVVAAGTLDVVALDAAGSIRSLSRVGDGWEARQIAAWPDYPRGGQAGSYRLFLAELDNNGALDLVVSGGGRTRVWLADGAGGFEALPTDFDLVVSGVLDLNGDGRLDLIGLGGGAPVRFISGGSAPYRAYVVQPRAQATPGDQRINSFGIGGDVEIRSGLLTQRQVITGPSVHFGLGSRADVDVVRILWPNGVTQAEFAPPVGEPLVAGQRLKGSCPWVFADDGTGMRFVTDFLWRSPLGLRINAQDTAGVTQTEDWVRIKGDQLAVKNGAYDVRITAELWETHFVDHVSLMAVDHPDGTEVFVDERFASTAPALTPRVTSALRPVARAWDESGRDVTDLVKQLDGRYLATFDLGAYQGVAADHYVEFDLGQDVPRDATLWLVASGWIYPTDSSINVAIGQGGRVQPRGLSLEAQDASGRWVVVSPDVGFPAGKNKTILLDFGQAAARSGVRGARRWRLRTNLEVYWDRLAVADGVDDQEIRTIRLQPERADLRYRGFSATSPWDRRLPEVPVYDRVANVTPRWRDLVGYYTRFGDVRELLDRIEDRYVIMNAGDELRLSFRAPAPPPIGWTRDFVLIGDGWVKDGDFNTTFSRTVEPLPRHGHPDYTSSPGELEDDPVYHRHPEDWQTYHTRFVGPGRSFGGLR